jgi:hypothetical protein
MASGQDDVTWLPIEVDGWSFVVGLADAREFLQRHPLSGIGSREDRQLMAELMKLSKQERGDLALLLWELKGKADVGKAMSVYWECQRDLILAATRLGHGSNGGTRSQ